MYRYTQKDLLLFIYNETSAEETAKIKAALETDWELREEYQTLLSAQKELEPISLAPDEKILENILQYAEKSVAEEVIANTLR